MSTNKLAAVLGAAAKRMRADFDASQTFDHRPEAGKSREGILCDFIAPRMPGHVKIAHSAEIATASGDVSGQCDVVLFDRSTPPILDTETYRIIPNECVYGVIEVKSSLDKTQLIDACEDLRQTKAMPKTAYYPASMYSQYNVHGRQYDHLPTLGLILPLVALILQRLVSISGSGARTANRGSALTVSTCWVAGSSLGQTQMMVGRSIFIPSRVPG